MLDSNAIIHVWNAALLRLGERPVSSTTETSAPANICRELYPDIRDSLLSWHPWPFATMRQALSRLAIAGTPIAPPSDYLFYYLLPTNPYCLQPLAINLAQHGQEFAREIYVNPHEPDEQYAVIATDAASVVLTYLARVSEALWPPMFVDLVATALAGSMAASITGKSGLRKELAEELEAKLTKFIERVGHEGLPRRFEADAADPVQVIKTEICNAALLRLALPMTMPFLQAAEVAQSCHRLYPLVRDRLLLQEAWPFATIRQSLTRLATAPLSDFLYQYALPTAPPCLRVLDIDLDSADIPYQRELFMADDEDENPTVPTPVILTDADAVIVRYIAQVDERAFPSFFKDLMALQLAIDVSPLVPEKSGVTQRLQAEWVAHTTRARDLAGHEDSPRAILIPTTYSDVRG